MSIRLKTRQKWLLCLTLLLWGVMAVRYPAMSMSVPLQVAADGTVLAGIGRNFFVGAVGCLTALANAYALKKCGEENQDIAWTFFIPCILFIVVVGSFPFFAGR